MLGLALADGSQMVDAPEQADTIVVNTCSFIGDAKESIDAILEMGELKKEGEQKLVVSGCLAQRYADQLTDEMPEVDHFIGTTDYVHISRFLNPDDQPVADKADIAGADFISFNSLIAKSKKKNSLSRKWVFRKTWSHKTSSTLQERHTRVTPCPSIRHT